MGNKQRKRRLWLALVGVFIALVGVCIAVVAAAGFTDAFSRGTAPGFVGSSVFAVAAVAVVAFGLWVTRRSGVPLGDALDWLS